MKDIFFRHNPEKEKTEGQTGRQYDLNFEVMPDLEQDTGKPIDSSGHFLGILARNFQKIWLGYKKIIIIFLFILAVVGGYFGYQKIYLNSDANISPQKTLPEISIPPPEEEKTEIDSDLDGLTDDKEAELATNSQKPDTDGDGLADGDEINIYGSDPLLLDTDNDTYSDGREVANGYSPIENSPEKASVEVIENWTEKIAEFGLHEPTRTTLKVQKRTSGEKLTSYVNSAYHYSVELPAVLTYREAEDGRLVGLFIAGTVPSDTDVSTDPITFSFAVKVENQTLKEWVETQYRPEDYLTMKEPVINSQPAISLTSLKGQTCLEDKTFFEKDNTVIIVTWSCSETAAFAELYNQIVKSFKFR